MERQGSKLFAPYKALGDVCSSVPPVFRTLPTQRKFTSVICAIDNVVVQYSCEHLRLISVSDTLPGQILSIAADKRYIYAAVRNSVAVLHLSRQIKYWLKICSTVKSILPFTIVDCDGARDTLIIIDSVDSLHIVSIDDGEEITLIESPEQFKCTASVHPATYLNKLLLGSQQGTLRLINVKSGRLLYEFGSPSRSPVTCLEQTPAVDVIAVGLQNGKVLLRNIKHDEILATYEHDASVTSVAFRTDGEETMTTSSECGTVAIWDLNKRCLVGEIPAAHRSSITKIKFLAGEPVMVSAGTDNTLKTWIYDTGDRMPRQLVLLEGHSKPLTAISFMSCELVLSASLDGSVRAFSLVRDTHRQKLGNAGIMSRAMGKMKKRDLESIQLKPVAEMKISHAREAAWDNLLCRHFDTSLTTTWTTRKQSLGSHRLLHERFLKTPRLADAHATAISLSSCGNFALIGYTSGHIDCFNVQSGLHRKTFVARKDGVAHETTVRGLALDMSNKQLVSVSEDGIFRFWDFRSSKLLAELKIPAPVKLLCMSDCNSLLAFAIGSGSIGVIDAFSRRLVRVIQGAHKADPTALDFSPDGKWLVSADCAGYIKVWDLVTNTLIDVMKCKMHCTALCFSSSGEYFATCHHEQRSVYLWANKTHFAPVTILNSLPFDFEPSTSSLPSYGQSGDHDEDTRNDSRDHEMDIEDGSVEQTDQVGDLVTLSGLALPRWANLPYLDIIRERNKPIEPAKKPKAAPFFLPTISVLHGFEFEKQLEDDTVERRKVIMAKRDALEFDSPFTQRLQAASCEDDYHIAFQELKSLSLSSIYFQIHILTSKVFDKFLRMLIIELRSRRNYELVQSYLATFLKEHRNKLWNADDFNENLASTLEELRNELCSSWDDLNTLLISNCTVLQWLKSALL